MDVHQRMFKSCGAKPVYSPELICASEKCGQDLLTRLIYTQSRNQRHDWIYLSLVLETLKEKQKHKLQHVNNLSLTWWCFAHWCIYHELLWCLFMTHRPSKHLPSNLTENPSNHTEPNSRFSLGTLLLLLLRLSTLATPQKPVIKALATVPRKKCSIITDLEH